VLAFNEFNIELELTLKHDCGQTVDNIDLFTSPQKHWITATDRHNSVQKPQPLIKQIIRKLHQTLPAQGKILSKSIFL